MNSFMKDSQCETIPQPKNGENRGDLAGVHIDPADNGYNMHAHFDAKDPKKGYPEPAHTVHPDRQHLLNHLDDILADHEAMNKKNKKKLAA